MMAFGGEAFGEVTESWGGALPNGISALRREAPASSLGPCEVAAGGQL